MIMPAELLRALLPLAGGVHEEYDINSIHFDGFNAVCTNSYMATVVRHQASFVDTPFTVKITDDLFKFIQKAKGDITEQYGMFFNQGKMCPVFHVNERYPNWRELFPASSSDHLPTGIFATPVMRAVCETADVLQKNYPTFEIRLASDGSKKHVVTYGNCKEAVSVIMPCKANVPKYVDVWECFV